MDASILPNKIKGQRLYPVHNPNKNKYSVVK